MHRIIEKYSFIWNAKANEGQIMLQLKPLGKRDPIAQVLLDSAQEGALLLDLLRNESPVFYDDETELLLTGFEDVGEGEISDDDDDDGNEYEEIVGYDDEDDD